VIAAYEIVANDGALTGESPVWSVAERALYWIDGRRDAIYRIAANGERTTWTTPSKVNAIAEGPGGLIVAMKSGIALLEMKSGIFVRLARPAEMTDDFRMNDGKVDRRGRFWFGTMHENATDPVGGVYRLDGDGSLTRVDEGFAIPNGFAWSPDERRMYLADSHARTIYVYDFDPASGAATKRRAFAEVAAGTMPDGCATDARGYLWSANVGGGAINRYAPDGTLERRIELPVTRPTSVCFGGDDLLTLYVTSASRNLTAEQLAAQPLAGAVFAVRVDVPGLPEHPFGQSSP